MNKQEFEEFIDTYQQLGGKASQASVKFIKMDIDENHITFNEIMKALKTCHSNEQFMNWVNVMSYLRGDNRVIDGGKW